MLGFAQGADGGKAHGFELVVGYGNDDGVIGSSGRLLTGSDAVFVLRFFFIDPGVVHIGLHVEVSQLFDDVHHAGVAQVGAVFFKGQAHHQPACA